MTGVRSVLSLLVYPTINQNLTNTIKRVGLPYTCLNQYSRFEIETIFNTPVNVLVPGKEVSEHKDSQKILRNISAYLSTRTNRQPLLSDTSCLGQVAHKCSPSVGQDHHPPVNPFIRMPNFTEFQLKNSKNA